MNEPQLCLQDTLRGFTAKVSDFGLSKLLPDGHTQRTDNVVVDDVGGTWHQSSCQEAKVPCLQMSMPLGF